MVACMDHCKNQPFFWFLFGILLPTREIAVEVNMIKEEMVPSCHAHVQELDFAGNINLQRQKVNACGEAAR